MRIHTQVYNVYAYGTIINNFIILYEKKQVIPREKRASLRYTLTNEEESV